MFSRFLCLIALLLCMPLLAQINPPVVATPGGVQSPAGLSGSASNVSTDKLQLYGATISPQQVPALQGGQTIVGGHITPVQTPNTLIGIQNPNGGITINSAGGSGSWNGVTGVGPWNPGGGGWTPPDVEEEEDGTCMAPGFSVMVDVGECACDVKLNPMVTEPDCECTYSVAVTQPVGSCQPGASLFMNAIMTYSGECAGGPNQKFEQKSITYNIPQSADTQCGFIRGNCPCNYEINVNTSPGFIIEYISVSHGIGSLLGEIILADIVPNGCNGSPTTICANEINNVVLLNEIVQNACEMAQGSFGDIDIQVETFNPVTGDYETITIDFTVPPKPTGHPSTWKDCTGFNKTDHSSPSEIAENLVEATTISPNPATNYINVNLPETAINEIVNIQISDLTGKSFNVYNNTADKNQLRLNIDDFNLSSGLYLINVQYAGNTSTNKLMITN